MEEIEVIKRNTEESKLGREKAAGGTLRQRGISHPFRWRRCGSAGMVLLTPLDKPDAAGETRNC